MNLILPLFLILRLRDENGKGIRLWIPLFLLWIFPLLAGIILTPLVLILSILLWRTKYGWRLLVAGPMLYFLLCGLRGLHVDIKGEDKEQVYIKVW